MDFFIDFLLIGFPLFFYLRKKELNKAELIKVLEKLGLKSFSKINLIEIIKGIIFVSIGLFFISFIIVLIAEFFGLNDIGIAYEKISLLKEIAPSYLIYLFIVRIFAEEFFFRGFLVNKIGVLWSATIFGLAHGIYGSVVEVVGAFILGLFLAKYFKNKQVLYPTIIGHIIHNFITLFLLG